MMKTTRTVCLFLLFLLLLHPSEADKGISTTNTGSPKSKDQSHSTTFYSGDLPDPYQLNTSDGINATGGHCLIDTEMGLIAIGSAGGLIICLLVTISVFACQICVLQRRVYIPRSRHSSTDLMSGSNYWGTEQTENEGLVGPCDTIVMLEEVRTNSKTLTEIQEAMDEAVAGHKEEKTTSTDPEEKVFQIQSSSSKDSCLEVPKNSEDMPLVV
ncbi:hypothetical protein CRENBAI_019557 [Crenichthys baileyi]|uniref:Uncharacterized protein n=1 Tax=Crenichthys baileyi TaxID=28760 RepID=A0AAV9R1W1_9TELE